MIKVAIIPAAGYKCTAERYYDTGMTGRYCPEALVPVSQGQTALSRLCSQLRQLGYIVFIGAGQVGSIYPITVMGLAQKHGIHQDVSQSPWTWKRIDYIAKQGIPILIHNPDDFYLPETVSQMIEVLGLAWDRMAVISGDYVLSDALLRDVLDQAPWPSRVAIGETHNAWLLTPAAAATFHFVTRLYRRKNQNTNSLGFIWQERFDPVWKRVGFALVSVAEMFPKRADEFVEIESRDGMGKALALVQRYPHKETE